MQTCCCTDTTMISACILASGYTYISVDCSWNPLTHTWAVRFCGCLEICPRFCLPFCSADTRPLAGGYLSSETFKKRNAHPELSDFLLNTSASPAKPWCPGRGRAGRSARGRHGSQTPCHPPTSYTGRQRDGRAQIHEVWALGRAFPFPAGEDQVPGTPGAALSGSPGLSGLPSAWCCRRAPRIWPRWFRRQEMLFDTCRARSIACLWKKISIAVG